MSRRIRSITIPSNGALAWQIPAAHGQLEFVRGNTNSVSSVLTVTGLPFTPRLVVAQLSSMLNSDMNNQYVSGGINYDLLAGNVSFRSTWALANSVANGHSMTFTASGFSCGVSETASNYTWIAIR